MVSLDGYTTGSNNAHRASGLTDIASVVTQNPNMISVGMKPSAENHMLKRFMVPAHDDVRDFLLSSLIEGYADGVSREYLMREATRRFGLFRYEVHHVLGALGNVVEFIETDGERVLMLTGDEDSVGGEVK